MRRSSEYLAQMSALFLMVVLACAIFAPLLSPYTYDFQNISERLLTPSLHHPFGTDSLGRDLLSRLLYGARMSLAVGVVSAFFSLILGTTFGVFAGYFGGWVDEVLMRTADLFYLFPGPLFAILMMLSLGRGVGGILFAIGATSWVSHARLIRGVTLQIKEMAYIESAEALGAKHLRMISMHVLPNLKGTLLSSLMIQIPTSLMSESFLSFIGLGLEPPLSSWGTLAQEGFRGMRSYPHLIIFPSVALFLTLLALNYLGDYFSKEFSELHTFKQNEAL
jgi:oligopeptide transport system permease protein